MTRTVHVCLDVKGAIQWGDRDLSKLLINHDTGKRLTAKQARAALLDELADGKKFLPMGKPCEGFSHETGCPGHDTTEASR